MSNKLAAVLDDLSRVIEARRLAGRADKSYIAKLLAGEEDAMLKKIVEEAAETALAARAGDVGKLAEELADLWFHCLIVMARYNIAPDDVAAVLRKRRGVSGLDEKAARENRWGRER